MKWMPLPCNNTYNDTCDAVELGHLHWKEAKQTSKGFRCIFLHTECGHAFVRTSHISGTTIWMKAQQKKTILNVCTVSVRVLYIFFSSPNVLHIERFEMNGSIMCCSPCEFHYNSIFSPPHHVWDELMRIMSKSVNCCCDCLPLYQSEQFFALAASFA